MAIMALLMSSSDAIDESTLTTSKSTGTQQNLRIKTDGVHISVTELSHSVSVWVGHWLHSNSVAVCVCVCLQECVCLCLSMCVCVCVQDVWIRTGIVRARGGPALVRCHLRESESQCACLHTELVEAIMHTQVQKVTLLSIQSCRDCWVSKLLWLS